MPQYHGYMTAIINATGDSEPMATTYAVSFLGLDNILPVTLDAGANAFATAIRARMGNTYSVTNIDWVYNDDGTEKGYTSTSGAGAGLVAGALLPQNCAVLVQKRSPLRGRQHRGRMYLPGVRENEVTELGVVSTTERAAYQTAFNTLWDYFDGTTPWTGSVILHNDEGATQTTLVTSLLVDPRVATQRRRLRR